MPRLRDHAPDLYTLDTAFAGDFRNAAQVCAATQSPEPLWQLMRGRCASFVPDALIEHACVRRMQALLRTLDAEDAAIADAAARHGYSDQAHATHDPVNWTGVTPARLVRALRGDRGSDEALRLATAFVRGTSVARALPERSPIHF